MQDALRSVWELVERLDGDFFEDPYPVEIVVKVRKLPVIVVLIPQSQT